MTPEGKEKSTKPIINCAHFSFIFGVIGTKREKKSFKNSFKIFGDFDLINDGKNGVQVIKDLNLQECSYIITNRFNDIFVQEQCHFLSVIGSCVRPLGLECQAF